MRDDTARRGNYESGTDYVLEYGNLRFSFNERDFSQRVEQAAVRLGFVTPGLTFAEINDLLHLAVSGEIEEPGSELGVHVTHNWEDLTGPGNPAVVTRTLHTAGRAEAGTPAGRRFSSPCLRAQITDLPDG